MTYSGFYWFVRRYMRKQRSSPIKLVSRLWLPMEEHPSPSRSVELVLCCIVSHFRFVDWLFTFCESTPAKFISIIFCFVDLFTINVYRLYYRVLHS